MPVTSRAMIFEGADKPLCERNFDVPEVPEPGAILVRVCLSTICGSDLHTLFGRRREPTPLVLGHEIVGEVVALGEGVTQDFSGQPLAVGDRVSWTIMACCGECFFCTHNLPQKCVALKKYGHRCCDDAPGLFGGYGEHCYLWPGTALFKVPAGLPDEWAAPANCALSTVIHGMEVIGAVSGERVLIQGAGLLGLNVCALLREAGAEMIAVTDVDGGRLAMAKRFGADVTIDVSNDVGEELRTAGGEHGFDVAYEVCGKAHVVPQALDALRIGGRYLIAGLVTPGSDFRLDGNQVTRKCLTVRGVHNYRPENLGTALQFLADHGKRYPYDEIVGVVYPLKELEAAVDAAASGKFIRVGVRP